MASELNGMMDSVGYKTVNAMITCVVPGIFDCLLEELVFCFCLLRGAALRVYLRDLSPALISVTLTIFM